MTNSAESEVLMNEDTYIKGIDGYRKFALAVPALSVSLSSALLAFEIYYLQYFYKPEPGFFAEDLIVALPMLGGSLFLVAAALAMDWVADSMSPLETRALLQMYPGKNAAWVDAAKGFKFRACLFSGAYALFAICLAFLLFLLIGAIPIFLQDNDVNKFAKDTILAAGAYYAALVLLKMMTKTLPTILWWSLGCG